MFQEVLTEQAIVLVVSTLMGVLSIGLTAASIRIAGFFKMKRDNEWLAKEQQWKDLLHETLERAARNAVGKLTVGGPVTKAEQALPSILAQVEASIPDTLKNLKTTAHSKAVKDIAETYAMDVARKISKGLL